MNFKNWVKSVNESSVKDDEMNRILDKISDGQELTNSEKKFLDKFNQRSEEHYKDFLHLTKNQVFDKINNLLESDSEVICDLYDRDGLIGLKIISIHNDFDEDFCYLVLKNGQEVKLNDNYLYDIIYDVKKDTHHLSSGDEYYEKIPVKK